MYINYLERQFKVGVVKKYIIRAIKLFNYSIWKCIPSSLHSFYPIHSYGNLLQKMVRFNNERSQNPWTYFYRNRPEVELISKIVNKKDIGKAINITVLGCSKGAEVYTIADKLQKTRSELNVNITGVDIVDESLTVAKKGLYQKNDPILERLTPEEINQIFNHSGDNLEVKSKLRKNVTWLLADVSKLDVHKILSPQDIIIANRFLCHMYPKKAEDTLLNIVKLINPGGYLFVSGIDLNIKTKSALAKGWQPVRELLEEIHDGDYTLRAGWPWAYWGLEPINKSRLDWETRYASVFQVNL